MDERDRLLQMSLVDKYASDAQKEFAPITMKEIAQSGEFECPKKYLNQRDAPLEIPIECVRNLCDAMDKDMDDRVSLEEIRDYINLKQLPFDDDVPEQMFEDAIRGRGFINEQQRLAPLSHDEIAAAVRGRHAWDTKNKEWSIQYRPFRNHWIVLLLTVNERIFAMPIPRVIPTKV